MAKIKLSGRAGKLKKEGKKLIIVYLSGRAKKFKRGKKLVIVYLSGRAGEVFKREANKLLISGRAKKKKKKKKKKSCLFFAYLARVR